MNCCRATTLEVWPLHYAKSRLFTIHVWERKRSSAQRRHDPPLFSLPVACDCQMAGCSDPEFVLSENQGMLGCRPKYFSLGTNEQMQALFDLTVTIPLTFTI